MPNETKIKILKILKGAAIASGGVFITYIAQELTKIDFGSYAAVAAGFAAIVINAIKEILKSYEN